MSIAIKVENLSKAYQLGQIGTGTVSRDIERWFAKLRGKEDPFLRIGETNNRTITGSSDVVWSLKDVSFEIESGDAVGIIGGNGAGKSTLLKILSKVTAPTTGRITGKGRIASLLEVGTGFHPELTGKENIFLNGAILGMRKKEIKRKFDEIVHFAGVSRYINTPVKRYSSGMYVRLAFAVAAHLESEILIVDEVLAVGDAEFQKKCLSKMNDVSRGEGRTVLFVSHNMGAIKNLCTKAIILETGKVILNGNVNEAIKTYTQIQTANKIIQYHNPRPYASILDVNIEGDNGVIRSDFGFDEQITVRLNCRITPDNINSNIGIKVYDTLDRCIFTSEIKVKELAANPGEQMLTVKIPEKVLTPGEHKISVAMHVPNVQVIDQVKDHLFFEILETGTDFYQYGGTDYGCVFVNCKWENVTGR